MYVVMVLLLLIPPHHSLNTENNPNGSRENSDRQVDTNYVTCSIKSTYGTTYVVCTFVEMIVFMCDWHKTWSQPAIV